MLSTIKPLKVPELPRLFKGMRLDDWMYVHRISTADLSRLINISKTSIGFWLQNENKPGETALRRLNLLSDGLITYDSFAHIVDGRTVRWQNDREKQAAAAAAVLGGT